MRTAIIVTPKKSVLDPQGEAVGRAMRSMGMEITESIRVGKYIEIELSTNDFEASKGKLNQICRDLLSNPIIEDYQIQLLSNDKSNVQASVTKSTEAKKTGKEKDKKAAVPEKKKSKKKL